MHNAVPAFGSVWIIQMNRIIKKLMNWDFNMAELLFFIKASNFKKKIFLVLWPQAPIWRFLFSIFNQMNPILFTLKGQQMKWETFIKISWMKWRSGYRILSKAKRFSLMKYPSWKTTTLQKRQNMRQNRAEHNSLLTINHRGTEHDTHNDKSFIIKLDIFSPQFESKRRRAKKNCVRKS